MPEGTRSLHVSPISESYDMGVERRYLRSTSLYNTINDRSQYNALRQILQRDYFLERGDLDL